MSASEGASRTSARRTVERALEEKVAREEHQRVEASRKLLASIVESSEDAIVSRATEGNILSWNRGAEKMFGYSAEEAIGQPISMLVPPECASELGQIQERVAQGESVGRYETVRMAKDGRRIDVSLVVSPIFDAAGRITGASSIHRDITERKRAEEALARRAEELERSNTELEQFAFVASHDLQEPLRMVASYTQLLAQRYQGKLDADADEFIAFAVEGAQRMQKLIQDLLTYSRLGSRREEFKPTECGQALGRALQNLAASIEESGASITHGPLPTVVAAIPEPGLERHQVRRPATAPRSRFGRAERRGMDLRCPGRRHRNRPPIRGPHLRHLPAPAPSERVSRHRHRPGHLKEDRGTPRGKDLG